jgi:hypothetical protein
VVLPSAVVDVSASIYSVVLPSAVVDVSASRYSVVLLASTIFMSHVMGLIGSVIVSNTTRSTLRNVTNPLGEKAVIVKFPTVFPTAVVDTKK